MPAFCIGCSNYLEATEHCLIGKLETEEKQLFDENDMEDWECSSYETTAILLNESQPIKKETP